MRPCCILLACKRTGATSGGTPEQIEYLVSRGCIPPLCDLLKVAEVKIVKVALEGLENILKVGKTKAGVHGLVENPFAVLLEDAGAPVTIERLQEHAETAVYEKSLNILERYFDVETVAT